MTVKELVRGQPTLTQLEIMQRADHTLGPITQHSPGRYFGGQLEPDEVEMLTAGLRLTPCV